MTDHGTLPRAHAATPVGKPRARSLGIPFAGTPGPWNAITDVPGVQVGYVTHETRWPPCSGTAAAEQTTIGRP